LILQLELVETLLFEIEPSFLGAVDQLQNPCVGRDVATASYFAAQLEKRLLELVNSCEVFFVTLMSLLELGFEFLGLGEGFFRWRVEVAGGG